MSPARAPMREDRELDGLLRRGHRPVEHVGRTLVKTHCHLVEKTLAGAATGTAGGWGRRYPLTGMLVVVCQQLGGNRPLFPRQLAQCLGRLAMQRTAGGGGPSPAEPHPSIS